MQKFLNQVTNIDALEALREMPNECVDICVTSPPYKDKDGYDKYLILQIFYHVYRVMKFDSLLFVNFGHLADFKLRPFELAEGIKDCNFKLNDTIVWLKNHYKPIQGNKRLNNLTEFIFMFYKGNMPNIDRLAIGVPYKDKTNAKRFARGRDLKCRGNLWEIPYETIQSKKQKLHNDRFPLALPEMCIKLSRLKSGVLLEPFAGSGTSCLAARNLGLNFIGYEKDKNNWETAKARLNL